MKLLKQFLLDFKISENDAIQILYKKSISKKSGRPKKYIKYKIFFEIQKILLKKKKLSAKSAAEILYKSKQFIEIQKFYGTNITSSKRVYNLYLEVNAMKPSELKGLPSLLK